MRNTSLDALETPLEFYFRGSYLPPDKSAGYAQNTPDGV